MGFQNHEFSRRIGPRPVSSKKSPKWCHFSRESSGWSIGGVRFYQIFSSFLVLNGQIVEFSRARGPDRRVFSCSNARSLNFLVFEGQIVGFSRAQIPDRRVFSCSRARSSSFLVLGFTSTIEIKIWARQKTPQFLKSIYFPKNGQKHA